MMNKLEEAIIYATVLYQGKVRKFKGVPFILHPMEVAQILSTMTDDEEIITAGILHDIVEDTDGTLEEIEKLRPDSLTVHSLAIKRAANLNIEMERYHELIKGSTNEMLLAVDACARRMNLFPYYLYRQKNIPGKLENVGYAAKGKESPYNILIMEEKMDILAMGAGASSKFVFHKENRIERVENVKNVDHYMERIEEMMERKQRMFDTLTDDGVETRDV